MSQAQNRNFKKSSKVKRSYQKKFDGDHPNHVYAKESRHLPSKILELETQAQVSKEKEESQDNILTTQKNSETKKQKPSKQHNTNISLMPIDQDTVRRFQLTVEKSCRCRFELHQNIPRVISASHKRFLADKAMMYKLETSDFELLDVIVSCCCVAQVLNTQGTEVRHSISHLEKFTRIDVQLPSMLGSNIKSIGNFSSEYGLAELKNPIQWCLQVLKSAYALDKNGHTIAVFEPFNVRRPNPDFHELPPPVEGQEVQYQALQALQPPRQIQVAIQPHPIPWSREGFDYFKGVGSDALKEIFEQHGGVKISIPLPLANQNRQQYLQSLNGWDAFQARYEAAANCYFINEADHRVNAELEGRGFSFVNPPAMQQILSWFNSIIDKYKRDLQSTMLQLFTCTKFTPTSQGNACQFVSRNGTEVSSSFLVPIKDATVGAIFNYNTGTEIVGNFRGLVVQNMVAAKAKAVTAGLKRKLHS